MALISRSIYYNKPRRRLATEKHPLALLRLAGWADSAILHRINNEVEQMMTASRNWSEWQRQLTKWIEELQGEREGDSDTEDDLDVTESQESLLPEELFKHLPLGIQALCEQINASYENNLFDCSAVLMRRLLKNLLVLSYQNAGIESEIIDDSGRLFALEAIVDNAAQNEALALSNDTKTSLLLLTELGNYSTRKMWYSYTQQDIQPHILTYRSVIEDLLWISGVMWGKF